MLSSLEQPMRIEIDDEKPTMKYSHSARKLTVELFNQNPTPEYLKHQYRAEKAVERREDAKNRDFVDRFRQINRMPMSVD